MGNTRVWGVGERNICGCSGVFLHGVGTACLSYMGWGFSYMGWAQQLLSLIPSGCSDPFLSLHSTRRHFGDIPSFPCLHLQPDKLMLLQMGLKLRPQTSPCTLPSLPSPHPCILGNLRAAAMQVVSVFLEDFLCFLVCSHGLIHPEPPAGPKGHPCPESPSAVTLHTFNPLTSPASL